MPKFRKKPVIIEAVQWSGDNAKEMQAFAGENTFYRVVNNNSLIIPTLDCDHTAEVNDWVILGVDGEYHPCKPDIFAQTYVLVD